MNIIPGSYVTHAKLPELGNGEVMSSQEGIVCIRFSTGNRNFKLNMVMRHLVVTTEAPALPPQKSAKRARKVATAKAVPKA